MAGSVTCASVAIVTFVTGVFGQAPSADRSVRDGVYTEAEATRGTSIYVNKCSACHDEGVKAPDLEGPDFLAEWADLSVGALYNRILTTMPADVPASLKERDVLDLTAYILRANRFPPGDHALDSVTALDRIKFESK